MVPIRPFPRRLVLTVRHNHAFPCMLAAAGAASAGQKARHGSERPFCFSPIPPPVRLCDIAPVASGPGPTELQAAGAERHVIPSPSSGRKASGLTPEAFESLLLFLGPTPEEAAKKYEDIRRRLIKIFICRGCTTPEELVDESFDRVARKADDLAPTYEGDPALYVYAVARRVHLEFLKKKPIGPPPPEPDSSEEYQHELDCLDECMELLPPAQGSLIREYYREEKSAKIEHRRALAARLGIGVNALRIRAHRIRAALQKCVTACVERSDDAAMTT